MLMNKFKKSKTMIKEGDYLRSNDLPEIALERYKDALMLLPMRSMLNEVQSWSLLWQICREEKLLRKKLLKRIKLTIETILEKDKTQNHHMQNKRYDMKDSEPKFKSIKIDHKGGYGTPGYEAGIYSNGKVEWKGLYEVTKEGKQQWHISDQKIAQLSEAIHKSVFWSLQNVYSFKFSNEYGMPMTVTDIGSIRLTVELIDGRNKGVVCSAACPEEFSLLLDEIERLTGINEYLDGIFN